MTGIIPINKGENITSFWVVNKIRRIVGEKKAGHTGTLDPNATGVLVTALGGATRFIELLPDHNKAYTATFKLGVCTDTLDIWGTVTKTSDKTASLDEIKELLPRFSGKIMQTPPMYSALKKDGVRLYELARRGEEVEREQRECEIFAITAENIANGEFKLNVQCSAGTYIRSLISDIGEALGTGACMTSLVRTYASGVSIENCVTLSELEAIAESGELEKVVIPVDKILSDYAAVHVTPAQAVRFKNGGELSRERLKNADNINGFCRVYGENEFLGLGELLPESENLTVKRVFSDR